MKSPKFLTAGLAILLFAITLLNGCSGGPPPTSPPVTDESEPNPSCTEADPLSLGISAHGWVQDKLDPIDFWTFDLLSDGMVDIHIYNDGPGDIDLGYNDSNYTWLGGSGLHGAGEDEFVNDIHLTAGTYFINVIADDDSGPYKPERQYRAQVTFTPDGTPANIGHGHFVGNGCLQVDSTGNPCLFYSSEPDKTITYARFNGATWDNITSGIKIVTAEGLEIDSADTPHIVYGSEFGAGTNYAYYDGSVWVPTVVYSITWPGTDSSIALDSNGLPHFGIHGGGGGGQGVWHYWFDGVDWNSEHPVSGDQLISPHIEIDQDDYPHIMTHYMYGSADLWHIYKTESGWTTDNLGIGGNQPQAVFDSNWNLHCAYLTGAGGEAVNHIGYFVWDGASWSTPVVVDDSSDLRNVALALDSNNYPHISYIDYNTHFLKYAWYDGIGWQIKTVVDNVEASWRTSIVILPGDVPVIAYNDLTNGTVECVRVR